MAWHDDVMVTQRISSHDNAGSHILQNGSIAVSKAIGSGMGGQQDIQAENMDWTYMQQKHEAVRDRR